MGAGDKSARSLGMLALIYFALAACVGDFLWAGFFTSFESVHTDVRAASSWAYW